MRTRCATLIGLTLCCQLLAAAPVTLQPDLAPAQADQWRFVGGDWQFHEGVLEQTNPARLSAAILREPCFRDVRFSLAFRIVPEGKGVRAAAIILHATGTMTYYWVHLDSKNRQVILTRSTSQNTWIEITRRRCPTLTDGVWHTAVVGLQAGLLTVELDGTEVVRATEQSLAAGRIGLGTSQGRVQFRNLKVEGETVAMEPLKDETPPYRIISHGEAAGPYQAFPDVCRLANGDLLCVFYAGYGHVSLPNAEWPRGGRVCMVRSKDEGRTWSKPEVLYDGPQDNRDPHIAQLANGTVICSFFDYWRGDAGTRYRSLVVRSHDGGHTWDTVAQPVTPEMWAVSAPVRQMPDGTLVLGVYTEGGGHAYGGVVRSTDGGKTWSKPIPIGQEAKLPLDAETDVILLKDGTLYAALRSSSINMHYATSHDLGLTWSPVQDIGFKGHAPHFTQLSTGEILLTHRVPETALHLSRDEAKTWQGPYVIDHVGGAYPSTVELRDGTVLAIYYEEGEGSAIRALRLRVAPEGVEWLTW
jgi:hypothetical protein